MADADPHLAGVAIKIIPPGDKPWTDPQEYNEESFFKYPDNQEDFIYSQEVPHVLENLGIKEGMVVADVGAGRGRVSWQLSRLLGPGGAVLAIDINPIAVRLMRARLKQQPPKHANLTIIHSHPWNVGLSGTRYHGHVDRAVMLEAHFFKHFPAAEGTLSCLRSLFVAMKPGGLLLVMEHKGSAQKAVTQPITRVGFVQVDRFDQVDQGKHESYRILFRRP